MLDLPIPARSKDQGGCGIANFDVEFDVGDLVKIISRIHFPDFDVGTSTSEPFQGNYTSKFGFLGVAD